MATVKTDDDNTSKVIMIEAINDQNQSNAINIAIPFEDTNQTEITMHSHKK